MEYSNWEEQDEDYRLPSSKRKQTEADPLTNLLLENITCSTSKQPSSVRLNRKQLTLLKMSARNASPPNPVDNRRIKQRQSTAKRFISQFRLRQHGLVPWKNRQSETQAPKTLLGVKNQRKLLQGLENHRQTDKKTAAKTSVFSRTDLLEDVLRWIGSSNPVEECMPTWIETEAKRMRESMTQWAKFNPSRLEEWAFSPAEPL